jgi:hypothetical protein
MKVIFLDVDGVLNWAATEHRVKVQFDGIMREYVGFCSVRVQRFNRIVAAHPDAKIVISSSWRELGLDNVIKLLRDAGLQGDIIDATPIKMGKISNGTAIRWWLQEHPEVDRFVILDDKLDGMQGWITKFNPRWDILETWEPDVGRDLRSYHVKTYGYHGDDSGGYNAPAKEGGLHDEHVELAIRILSGFVLPVSPLTDED